MTGERSPYGGLVEEIFTGVAVAFELIGAVVIVVGFVLALWAGGRILIRRQGGQQAFHTVRSVFGGAILLGLEVLVGADLIRTITSPPSLEDALILGVIVLIRTILSVSIQVEIDGVLPWRRALLTSGAQVMSRGLRTSDTKD